MLKYHVCMRQEALHLRLFEGRGAGSITGVKDPRGNLFDAHHVLDLPVRARKRCDYRRSEGTVCV